MQLKEYIQAVEMLHHGQSYPVGKAAYCALPQEAKQLLVGEDIDPADERMTVFDFFRWIEKHVIVKDKEIVGFQYDVGVLTIYKRLSE
jgi:hypothetical protein